MTKINVLRISAAYAVYAVVLFFTSITCHSDWCRINDEDFLGQILFLFAPLLPIFLLSLVTYKMRDEVFHAWWGFARWWAPIIVVATILLNNLGGGGTLGMNKDFTAFILIILYSILGIVSLVKIVRAYFAARR